MVQNIPSNVRQSVAHALKLKGPEELRDFAFSGGGCINQGGKLKTDAGTFFLKWNSAKRFPSMFRAEAKGLTLLKTTEAIEIPAVITVGEDDDFQYILLDFIEQGPQAQFYWKHLGSRLATLHKTTNTEFGLDHENYIGSLQQFNTTSQSWIDFFIHQRLNVQVKRAVDSGLAGGQMMKAFETLYPKLTSLLSEEKPALLHGDLWSGNIITSSKGEPCLIDPAVYFGCREVDLAMTRLFGSFPTEFYNAYHQTYPLLPDYEDRFDLYNLYPLLVHLNLFGIQYKSAIMGILNRFI
ncbi:MAG TPA: fructosamine kinase family protein [Chryseolinea sp.]